MLDADHTLAFMDFVRDHSPDERYTQAHEQYRGLVLFHRTQAAAAQAVETDDPEAAVDAIHEGLEKLRAFFVSLEAEEHFDDDLMVGQLQKMEQGIRQKHNIETTLQEQLADAGRARIMKAPLAFAISSAIAPHRPRPARDRTIGQSNCQLMGSAVISDGGARP